jgi:hypothetical protein
LKRFNYCQARCEHGLAKNQKALSKDDPLMLMREPPHAFQRRGAIGIKMGRHDCACKKQ